MKALWFLPFTFAAGAEGFALFAPYLIAVLTVLYVTRTLRASAVQPAVVSRSSVGVMPVAQPVL